MQYKTDLRSADYRFNRTQPGNIRNIPWAQEENTEMKVFDWIAVIGTFACLAAFKYFGISM